MPLRVIFTPDASASLDSIAEYIALDSTSAARDFVLTIQARCAALSDFPQLGRVYNHSYRILVEGKYLIFYRVSKAAAEQEVTIVLIAHGARDLRSVLE